MNDKRRQLFTNDAKFIVNTPANGKPATLIGYAMVWNVLSSDRGGYKLMLAPNSAKFTNPTLALWHHDYLKFLARSDDNSLRITSDNIGAKVEIDLPDTSYAKDLQWLVANNKIRGMSFAMLMAGLESSETTQDSQSIELVTSFNCDEVTVAVNPSFDQTSIGIAGDNAADTALTASKSNKENILQLQKGFASDMSKLDKYRLDLYHIKLAELQQVGGNR